MCSICFKKHGSRFCFRVACFIDVASSLLKTNVFLWPPRNILKGNKSNKLPGLVDAHGRGHMVAIIKPVKRFVSSFGPDDIFESDKEEEGHFSFVD